MNTKKKKNRIVALIVAIAIVLSLLAVVIWSFVDNKVSEEISVEQAQQIVDDAFDSLPQSDRYAAGAIFDKTSIKVNSLKYGYDKDVILNCTYSTIDVAGTIIEHKEQLVGEAYKYYAESLENNIKQNATKIALYFKSDVKEYLAQASALEGEITLYLYETSNGNFSLYLSDEVVDTCTGGILTGMKAVDECTTTTYKGETVDITNTTTVRTGIKQCFALKNYDSAKPATGNFIKRWCEDFADEFYRNFIAKNRWLYLLQGLGTTIAITLVAGLLGIVLGFIVAIIRCTNETTGRFVLIDRICRLYLTVIRGTPVMVQLLIIYFVLLLPLQVPKFIAAVLCFGLNSGAYVAEIVRGGIMSIDKGQTEAGRSLGFNFPQTMMYFIIPQAFKAVLPALANEFITLLKESSVAFYIGVADLTQGGLKIRSITYSNFMPLIAVALIYLAIVLILTKLVGILERRLRKSDH